MTEAEQTGATKCTARASLTGSLAGMWSLVWRSRLALRKIPSLVLLFCSFPALVWLILRFNNQENLTEAFHEVFIFFFLFQVTPLVCLITFGAMMRDEIRHDTIGFFLVRPTTRGRLSVVKYLTLLAWIQIVFLIELMLLLAVGLSKGVPHVLATAPDLFIAQTLAVLAWSAISGFIGLMTKNYVVWGITLGSLIEVGIAKIPTNINNLALTNNLKTLMARDELISGLFGWSADGGGTALTILLIVPLIFAPLSMLLFTWREYLQSSEQQK